MNQQLYAGVPVTVTVAIVNAAGAAYDLASVSATYGFIGSGPPSVVALTSSETGIYTATITTSPYHQGTLTVRVSGYDAEGNLQAVGVCQVPVVMGAFS